jgi:hypothetical protein
LGDCGVFTLLSTIGTQGLIALGGVTQWASNPPEDQNTRVQIPPELKVFSNPARV